MEDGGVEGVGDVEDAEEEDEEEETTDTEREEDDEDGAEEAKPKKAPAPAKKAPAAGKKGQPVIIRYDVVADAGFKAGEEVPYLALAHTFERVESTTQRLAKTEHLANLFRSIVHLSPADLVPTLYLVKGTVAPDFENVEVGVGESLLVAAIASASGTTPAAVKAQLRDVGDLGTVAVRCKKKTRTLFPPPPLTVREVFGTLKAIAGASGSASRTRKQDSILRLLVSSREQEARYVIRMLQGKFRIGCSDKTVYAALARALVQTPVVAPGESAVLDTSKALGAAAFAEAVARAHNAITRALAQVPSYDVVVPLLLQPHGVEHVREQCHIRVGMPVHPMLAQPTKGIGEVLSRLATIGFTCEYKYDGERAQIHISTEQQKGSSKRVAKVFSRNLEDTTSKYPDVAEACRAAAADDVVSCIIDSEAVGWDADTKKLLPFQTLMRRARKGVDLGAVKIRVCVKAFDLLYLNGESLLERPFRERRELLHKHFHETEGQFMFATYKNIASSSSSSTSGSDAGAAAAGAADDCSAEVQPFLEEAVAHQCEGLMVKALDAQSEYVPAERSFNWLKIKKDYMEGMTDSVDLVPIAGWYGTGKRTGWYGGFLLACYDDDTESFQSITKVGTGFSDADLAAFRESLVQAPARKAYYTVSPNMKEPDVWFEATQVWEVKGADLTISPAYCAAAGHVDESKGVSLRFPRFLRVRDDKKPEDATKAEQIAELYRKQTLCITKPTAAAAQDDY